MPRWFMVTMALILPFGLVVRAQTRPAVLPPVTGCEGSFELIDDPPKPREGTFELIEPARPREGTFELIVAPRVVVGTFELISPWGDSQAACAAAVSYRPEDCIWWVPCPPRYWFSAEYLLIWTKASPLPNLLVTGDTTNGASPNSGGLDNPTTFPVIGGQEVSLGAFSGARFQGGVVLGNDVGLEGGIFFLGQQHATLETGSDANGDPFRFRPFVNVDTGNRNAGSIVAQPDLLAGVVAARLTSRLWGADVRVAAPAMTVRDLRLTGLLGFRYLDLTESLAIDDARIDLAGIGDFGGRETAAGDRFLLLDRFRASNQFYGAQVGLRAETCLHGLLLSALVRVSLGDNQQTLNIAGSSTLLPVAGSAQTLPGGVLALPSNSGTTHPHDFAVIPELTLQAGYDLSSCVRVALGYDLLYWNRVIRPGDQAIPVVSASQMPTSPTFGQPGQPVPPPPHQVTDFWMQGLHCAVILRY